MDTSEAYVKMCEKAEEIQLDFRPQDGDYIVEVIQSPRNVLMSIFVHPHHRRYIWLPRQDQLQEMISEHWNLTYSYGLVERFANWLRSSKVGYYENLSMEQLWLAFVMSQKYNKVWDGEEWVKVNADIPV